MFRWVDCLLKRAVAAFQDAVGTKAAADSFRGLYLQHGEVEQLLAREPGLTPFEVESAAPAEQWPDSDDEPDWVSTLRAEFLLTAMELRVLAIALAPEFDLRYERIYAFLQDDVSRKRPSVDLILNLLCPTIEAKLQGRAWFLSDAPLLRYKLVHLVADPSQVAPPLLAHVLKLDEHVTRMALGQTGLDARLHPFCTLTEPGSSSEAPVLADATHTALETLAVQACENRQPLLLHFLGPPRAGQKRVAEWLAATSGMPLLIVDTVRCLLTSGEFECAVPVIHRTARERNAVVLIEGFDALVSGQATSAFASLVQMLREFEGICILAGGATPTSIPDGVCKPVCIQFGAPGFSERRTAWKTQLEKHEIPSSGPDLDMLASRYRLHSGQIADTVAAARNAVRWHAASEGRTQASEVPTLGDLCAAARLQTAGNVTGLARKIEPKATWKDLVLPANVLALLRDLCAQAQFRQTVFEDWGFGQKLTLGKGLVALFSGPPGTGKTLTAEVIANHLALDLFKIDLSQVVSKYIGETEKNLDRVFDTAQQANAILLFDEADALFGQRSQVRDAHDRYANIEVGYLLQKMEEYDGVAILASNLASNMDGAFVRRLTFRIEFPFPDETYRQQIWRQMFTPAMPLSPDLDFSYLANQFKLAGGNIKNAVLAAAFLAAAAQEAIGMKHLVRALFREFQKMGKTCAPGEFGAYAEMLNHARS